MKFASLERLLELIKGTVKFRINSTRKFKVDEREFWYIIEYVESWGKSEEAGETENKTDVKVQFEIKVEIG